MFTHNSKLNRDIAMSNLLIMLCLCINAESSMLRYREASSNWEVSTPLLCEQSSSRTFRLAFCNNFGLLCRKCKWTSVSYGYADISAVRNFGWSHLLETMPGETAEQFLHSIIFLLSQQAIHMQLTKPSHILVSEKKKCFCCILMMFAIMNQVVTLQFLTKQWKVLKRLREKSVMTNWPLTIRYIVHPSNQSSVTHQAVVYSSWSEVLPFRHVYIFTGSSWST